MRFAVSALLTVRGVAHLVGFVVPWKLMTTPEMPYRSTIPGGVMDVGDAGVRAWMCGTLGCPLVVCAVG